MRIISIGKPPACGVRVSWPLLTPRARQLPQCVTLTQTHAPTPSATQTQPQHQAQARVLTNPKAKANCIHQGAWLEKVVRDDVAPWAQLRQCVLSPHVHEDARPACKVTANLRILGSRGLWWRGGGSCLPAAGPPCTHPHTYIQHIHTCSLYASLSSSDTGGH